MPMQSWTYEPGIIIVGGGGEYMIHRHTDPWGMGAEVRIIAVPNVKAAFEWLDEQRRLDHWPFCPEAKT